MELTSKTERRLYDMLMDRLEKISHEVGYFEEPQESSAYEIFLKAWDDYLDRNGITTERKYVGRMEVPGKVVLDDPMYLEKRGLLIPEDFADRALALGVVP
jgi:hypothetical protein